MAAPAAHNRCSAAVPVPAATVYTVELPPVLAVYTEMLLPAAPAGSDSGSDAHWNRCPSVSGGSRTGIVPGGRAGGANRIILVRV